MATDLTFALARSVKMLAADPEVAHEAFAEVAQANMEPCSSCGKPIKHRKGLNWCLDNEMREEGPRGVRAKVTARAKRRGWTVAHAGKGWVGNHETGEGQFITPMMKGWPDLFLLNPNCKAYQVFFIECKDQAGQPDEDQVRVMKLLIACGIKGAVIRPSDLRDGSVNAILEGR
jgi:hypothetical protein